MTETPSLAPVNPAAAPKDPGDEAKEAARRLREAEALRSNLHRRKEQARARAGKQPAPE